MRYADHLAIGKGIVWNIGEAPVDGATDFLFLVMIAGISKFGISIENATSLLGIIAHLSTIILIYWTTVFTLRQPIWLGLFNGLLLLIGPGLAYIQAGFGATVFAFMASLTWFLAIHISYIDKEKKQLSLYFAVFSLLLGLIRPEGVFLASFMLLALVYFRGLKNATQLLSCFIFIFLIFGGSYFIWRWYYFGYPLPNPFYKKGGGTLYFDALRASIQIVYQYWFPFSIIFLLGINRKGLAKKTIFILIPIVLFTGIWVLLSNEMNFYYRFQYPIYPILLMSYTVLVKELGLTSIIHQQERSHKFGRFPIYLISAAIILLIVKKQHRLYLPTTNHMSSRVAIAKILATYKDEGYTLAVTEAGLLPFYSRWRTIDTWGLNDQWIAHNKKITPAYLDQNNPEIIMMHIDPNSYLKGWEDMTTLLDNYAINKGYCLIADFKNKYAKDSFKYYIRPNFKHSQEITEKIRKVEYLYPFQGEKAENIALSKDNWCY